MESNRTGRRTVLRTAGAVAAAMQVNRHLSVPIVTTALALALAACGAGGTGQNVGAKSTAQGGGSGSVGRAHRRHLGRREAGRERR